MSKFLFFITSFQFLILQAAPICEDLAKATCAPGRYDDGTGVVRSERDVQDKLTEYANQIKPEIDQQVRRVFEQTDGTHFKQKAIAALGLNALPVCQSRHPAMILQCETNAIEGVSELIQNTTIKSLLPNAGNNRVGNLEELAYITRDNRYLSIVQNINEKLNKDLIDQSKVDKIKNQIFPNVKKAMIDRLRQLNIPSEKLNFMINKINGNVFAGANCTEEEGGDVASNVLLNNANYTPMNETIRFCSGLLLQSDSEFTIAGILAHELAHSIDPCNINKGPADYGFHYTDEKDIAKCQTEYPLSNVIQCLRSPRSVAARNYTAERNFLMQQQQMQMQQMMQAQQLAGRGLSAPNSPNSRPPINLGGGIGGGMSGYYGAMGVSAANPAPTIPNFCEEDQIGESFSDWMMAEALPLYMEKNHRLSKEQFQIGYSNVFRTFCTNANYTDQARQDYVGKHPIKQDRYNKITLSNPKIREQMGCQAANPNAVYCDNVSTYSDSLGGNPVYIPSGLGGVGIGGVPANPVLPAMPAPNAPTSLPRMPTLPSVPQGTSR